MSVQHLPATGYVSKPWKTGRGLTEEIYLLPLGADRDGFDLRISRALISEPGLFSAFPGADRVITVIEGAGLTLDFGDRRAVLQRYQPFGFDTGLTPDGLPLDGPVRVLNVMASRRVWRIDVARFSVGDEDICPELHGLVVIFAAEGALRVEDDAVACTIATGDTALVDRRARLRPLGQGKALIVPLSPVGQGR